MCTPSNDISSTFFSYKCLSPMHLSGNVTSLFLLSSWDNIEILAVSATEINCVQLSSTNLIVRVFVATVTNVENDHEQLTVCAKYTGRNYVELLYIWPRGGPFSRVNRLTPSMKNIYFYSNHLIVTRKAYRKSPKTFPLNKDFALEQRISESWPESYH